MHEVKFNSVFQNEFKSLIFLKRSLGFKYEENALAFERIDSFFAKTDFPINRSLMNYAVFGVRNVPMKAMPTTARG